MAASEIITLATGLISLATGFISLIILLSSNEHILFGPNGQLQAAFAEKGIRRALLAFGAGILILAAGFGLKGYRDYERNREKTELTKAAQWLNRYVPNFSAINYSDDRVLGAGFETLDYVHIDDCTLKIKRTFHPYPTQSAPTNSLASEKEDYSEAFEMTLTYSKMPTMDTVDFGGTKYPAVRITPIEGNVLWHNEYINLDTHQISRQQDGSSVNYEVGLYFPNQATAQSVFARLSTAVSVCSRLAE